MEVTKKMTSGSDIILKSWLRTLRYSIEYYDDTFDSENNRRSENNRSEKNMVISGDTSDDSDDGRYVNVWDCADGEKSASKLKNSLESVENVSEVSNLESLNTVSGTDLSTGSYCLEEIETVSGNFGDSLKTTDLDDDNIVEVKRTKKKPIATPRLSKSSECNEPIYVNLPLRSRDSGDLQFPKSSEDFKDLPVFIEGTDFRTQRLSSSLSRSETSPIYENLPLISSHARDSFYTSSDSVIFEEEVSSTIQYLENVIESVDTYSDESDSDSNSNRNDAVNIESCYSTINSNFEEETLYTSSQIIDDSRYTDSSSSFEEYLSNNQFKTSIYKDIEVAPESLNLRFAKDNRVSAFFEEQEPGLPQEVKNIPIPKSRSTSFVIRNRFSVPLSLTEGKEEIRRPQSLESRVTHTKYQSNIDNCSKILRPDALGVDIDSDTKNTIEEVCISTKEDIIDSAEVKTQVDNTEHDLESFDISKVCLRKKNEASSSSSCNQDLNLSFAKESRISNVFEEGLVNELQILDPVPINFIIEEQFVENLREGVLIWMTSLMEECSGEFENIMEEKELLKSINQVPKDRTERPTENKFPLDDDVEVRRRPEIRTNRYSKTTDFDLGKKKQANPLNPKNFEIRGILKIDIPSKTVLFKLKEEFIAYENENFYRINEKSKKKESLAENVIIKSVKYPRSKESKEVELRDSKNVTYVLHFQDLKHAKQFMENEKVQVYIIDNKVTIKKTLLRFLGKRSSREILEKKGIYKNEPIFGNTLRDIYTKCGTNSLVPAFIYDVIILLEKPENIKSLGVYRTSGNLATIQKIRFEVDNGRLNILGQYAKDPDVLTGSLKLFFRELKEPLIPREVCEKLLDFARLDPKQISSKDHQKIRSTLVKNLHEANLETFVVLMRHLLEVIKYKEHNKMDPYNLAVCWGPSIIFPVHGANLNPTAELSKDIVTQSHDALRLVEFFLVYYDLYPAELGTLGKRQRPESITERISSLKRQESRDSVGSLDSSKSQKKSASSISLSVDEITKKLIEFIEPHVSCEGLYKKPGSADKTNKIMKKLNKKKINELDKYKNDVHDLTDALKRYLKEQDCLVSDETIELVLRISPDSSHSCLEPATRRKLISLIEDSPKKDTLIFLLRHLAKVVEYQETTFNVPKNDLIDIWTTMLNNPKKSKTSNEYFSKFLAIAVKVFNDNLPDVVRSSLNNNGGSPNRNDSLNELMKEMKHQQAERDRNSRYDNVDSDVGEASILGDKTEQTKL